MAGGTIKADAVTKAYLPFDFLPFLTPRVPLFASGFPGFSAVVLSPDPVTVDALLTLSSPVRTYLFKL